MRGKALWHIIMMQSAPEQTYQVDVGADCGAHGVNDTLLAGIRLGKTWNLRQGEKGVELCHPVL